MDPESTITFHGDPEDVRGRVSLTDPEEIESALIGPQRPRTFEERYPFAGQIGEGGMGDVHLATDRILGRSVAIKVLRAGKHPDKLVLQRFLREAQVTAQLAHPNVIPCYALENTGEDSPAFVMKLIEGVTFKEYVERCAEAWGTPSWDHDVHGLKIRVEHFVKACDAVAYGHERGVIHRDLKPANLMLGDHNVVYVMDWGIAKIVGERFELDLRSGGGGIEAQAPDTRTQTGDIVGTPLYMSPEQVNLEGDRLTPASDQYSLALVLLNLVTGEAPREGANVIDVIQRAGRGERAPFSDEGMGKEAPKELRAIIDRATRAEPRLRYPSVAEFAADLRRFLHGDPVRAHPDNLLRALWRRIQKHPVKAMSALLVVIVAAASVSTWSLLKALRHEREQLEAEERMAREARFNDRVRSAVADHVHLIDSHLARREYLVGTLATEAAGILRWASGHEQGWLSDEDFRSDSAPADYAGNDRYGFPVSFSRCVGVLAPGVAPEDVAAITRHFGRFEALLKRAAVLTLGPVYYGSEDPSGWSEEEAARRLREADPAVDEEPAQYFFLGFEEGIAISFPGTGEYADTYDPRQRPWYLRGSGAEKPTWGALYADASGSAYLLPCVMALRGPGGERLGVAGVDVTLERALRALAVPDLEGVDYEAWLVDGNYEILFKKGDPDGHVPAGLHGNREKERRPLGMPGLTQEIDEGHRTGILFQGRELFAFAQMRTLDWTLVVRVEVPDELD